MNFNMNIPGLKDVEVTKIEELETGMAISIEHPRQAHQCPACQQWTTKVHDYRIQKIKLWQNIDRFSCFGIRNNQLIFSYLSIAFVFINRNRFR
ncbi:hypothetical protein MKZ25_03110 [Solibacillus sp. FSL W7-1464]|uniref:hypothetical protein n=1 Tax=Solibacillus sp. FSL W7-1464 TaxID=2921706 RepID=UPI0030FAFCDD